MTMVQKMIKSAQLYLSLQYLEQQIHISSSHFLWVLKERDPYALIILPIILSTNGVMDLEGY